ncbi:MAG TPA: hypothetical protein VMV47_14270 [Bacteroidales bacterium]|nr:hypothetical protein [Bacteroidales bacterium]
MNNISDLSSTSFHRPGCNCCHNNPVNANEMTRRKFVSLAGTGAIGTVTFSGLTWSSLLSEKPFEEYKAKRQPLVVKPIITYDVPTRRNQTSWRSWGGIQTEKDAAVEIERINGELKILKGKADFPIEFLKVSGARNIPEVEGITDLQSADIFLVYAAGGGMNMFDTLNRMDKDIVFFCRHRSGPVYLWYEIISPRYLRQHTDKLAVKGITENDVVIDNQDEILWRLRSLAGLKNTVGSRILAIGGAGAWAQPLDAVMKVVKEKYKLDIQDITYDELGKLIEEAKHDNSTVARAKSRAGEYLKIPGTKLETKQEFVENCFVLEEVFIRLMDKFNCRSITVNNCMGTIMPLAESTACLTLSLLNDSGYLAFCESDFVVVPSGILLANITGKPVFLNDPTYPHDRIITLAHCTAPRRMDGKKLEPARLLTHFESDYGAAPKVEMLIGQTVTNIMPDFEFKCNVGMTGKIIDNPMLDICRSQIDISFECDSRKVAEVMPGFHWNTVYGDYIKETSYALKKIGIELENLG